MLKMPQLQFEQTKWVWLVPINSAQIVSFMLFQVVIRH
jgi:hypothetical protein